MYVEELKKAKAKFVIPNTLAIILGVVIMYFFSQSQIIGVGTALVAGGSVRMANYNSFKSQAVKEYVDDLVEQWGILDLQQGRGRAEKEQYEELMRKCDNKLHIQAISLSRFQNDLGHVLDRLGDLDVEIRLLLLDPDSDICKWYGEADPERGDLPATIKDSTRRFAKRDIETLEVRYYDAMPSNYFRVDSKAFVGPYFISEPSRTTLTFLGRTDGDLVDSYARHFESLWEEGRQPDPMSS